MFFPSQELRPFAAKCLSQIHRRVIEDGRIWFPLEQSGKNFRAVPVGGVEGRLGNSTKQVSDIRTQPIDRAWKGITASKPTDTQVKQGPNAVNGDLYTGWLNGSDVKYKFCGSGRFEFQDARHEKSKEVCRVLNRRYIPCVSHQPSAISHLRAVPCRRHEEGRCAYLQPESHHQFLGRSYC